MKCFLTVALGENETDLGDGERAHDCSQFFNAKRTSMSVEADEIVASNRKISRF
jgi:hypothetical protein